MPFLQGLLRLKRLLDGDTPGTASGLVGFALAALRRCVAFIALSETRVDSREKLYSEFPNGWALTRVAESHRSVGNDWTCMGGPSVTASAGRPAPGCEEFEFDLVTPFFAQVAEVFLSVEPVSLSLDHLDAVEKRPGLYGLTHEDAIVYVGKADADVQGRLLKHRRQLSGRLGISPDEVLFRCVYLARTWDPFKPEESLQSALRPIWNFRGFGPNDPGRNRDRTYLNDAHWHVTYPLDPDWSCDEVEPGEYAILDLLRKVASTAPYWVRFQGNQRGNRDEGSVADYDEAQLDFSRAARVVVPHEGMSVRELLLLAVGALPDPMAWQLTQLPSHILLYRETDASYPRSVRLWPPEDAD